MTLDLSARPRQYLESELAIAWNYRRDFNQELPSHLRKPRLPRKSIDGIAWNRNNYSRALMQYIAVVKSVTWRG